MSQVEDEKHHRRNWAWLANTYWYCPAPDLPALIYGTDGALAAIDDRPREGVVMNRRRLYSRWGRTARASTNLAAPLKLDIAQPTVLHDCALPQPRDPSPFVQGASVGREYNVFMNVHRPHRVVLSLLLSACTRIESEVVEFQGRKVEVVDAGDGPTTIVFEAGLGDDWKHWHRVASDLSEDTRVFAYSRPGYGDSDETTTPRDPAHIVEELRELLASQDIAPPYVLVGHSNGGTYMEFFARAYPEEVAGLVLVDSRPSDFLAECEAAKLEQCGVPSSSVEAKGGVFAAEYNAFSEASEELTAAGTFGAYPVRVMTATRRSGKSPGRMALWTSMHASLAEEAEDGAQILVHGTHYLQVFHAQKVAEVIRSVLP